MKYLGANTPFSSSTPKFAASLGSEYVVVMASASDGVQDGQVQSTGTWGYKVASLFSCAALRMLPIWSGVSPIHVPSLSHPGQGSGSFSFRLSPTPDCAQHGKWMLLSSPLLVPFPRFLLHLHSFNVLQKQKLHT